MKHVNGRRHPAHQASHTYLPEPVAPVGGARGSAPGPVCLNDCQQLTPTYLAS